MPADCNSTAKSGLHSNTLPPHLLIRDDSLRKLQLTVRTLVHGQIHIIGRTPNANPARRAPSMRPPTPLVRRPQRIAVRLHIVLVPRPFREPNHNHAAQLKHTHRSKEVQIDHSSPVDPRQRPGESEVLPVRRAVQLVDQLEDPLPGRSASGAKTTRHGPSPEPPLAPAANSSAL